MQGTPGSIGRYQILSELGQGAMGMVYLAQDPVLKRKVAIKVMKERGAENSSIMERFRREAETSSRLNHPNVITVYDVGEDPEAGPFLAMEYVEGASLSGLIQRETLGPEAGLEILVQVMRGLHAAGVAGIIHRDVKPENILVSKDGRVKLMDFGIAKADASRLTTTGMVVGTPSYTAPELLLGKEAGHHTDIYAFAVTAFEVFSGGCLPYTGDSLGVTLYRIVHEPPQIPSDMDPHLARVFQQALHKDPSQRYPTLGTLVRALAEALDLPVPPLPEDGNLAAQAMAAGRGSQRPSQEDIRTGVVPAPRKGRGGARSSGSGEMAKHLAAPPEDLLHHWPGSTPRPPAPEPPSHPATPRPPRPGSTLPGTVPRPAHPTLGAPVRRESEWSHWVKLALILAVIAAGGIKGWMMYQDSQVRTLSIHTYPPGATVTIDGEERGKTNLDGLQLTQKAKLLTLWLVDYREVQVDLSKSGDNVDQRLKLQDGFIRVLSNPSGAEVLVNGVPQAQRTPIWSLQVEDRAVVLDVVKKGYETKSLKVSAKNPPPEPILLQPSR